MHPPVRFRANRPRAVPSARIASSGAALEAAFPLFARRFADSRATRIPQIRARKPLRRIFRPPPGTRQHFKKEGFPERHPSQRHARGARIQEGPGWEPGARKKKKGEPRDDRGMKKGADPRFFLSLVSLPQIF